MDVLAEMLNALDPGNREVVIYITSLIYFALAFYKSPFLCHHCSYLTSGLAWKGINQSYNQKL